MEGSILVRRFAAGDIIVQPEERARALYIVHSGAVEVRGAADAGWILPRPGSTYHVEIETAQPSAEDQRD